MAVIPSDYNLKSISKLGEILYHSHLLHIEHFLFCGLSIYIPKGSTILGYSDVIF